MSVPAAASGRAVAAWRAVAGAWDRFWFDEVDGLPLGLVRCAFAAVGLIYWVGHTAAVRALYADPLDFPISSARAWSPDWLARAALVPALSGAVATYALWSAYGLALLALLLGWRTRAAALLAWLLTCWFQLRNPSILNAGDAVLRLGSFYLAAAFLFVRSGDRALSLDRRRAGAAGQPRVPAWTLRLLQIQVALIYFVSGFWKLADPAWRGGRALWIALANPIFSRFGPPARAPHALFAAATLSVAAWEFLFPALVSARRTRRWTLAFGAAIHLFILIFLNTGIFPLAMLALYPAFASRADGAAGLAAHRSHFGTAQNGGRLASGGAPRVLTRITPRSASGP